MYRDDRRAAWERLVVLERENAQLKRRIAARTARGRRILRRLFARNAKRYLRRRLPLLAAMAAIATIFSAMHAINSLRTDDSTAPENAAIPPTDAGVLPADVSEHGMPARLMCDARELEGPMCMAPRVVKTCSGYNRTPRTLVLKRSAYLYSFSRMPVPAIAPLPNP